MTALLPNTDDVYFLLVRVVSLNYILDTSLVEELLSILIDYRAAGLEVEYSTGMSPRLVGD